MHASQTRFATCRNSSRGAFTLVELLVVIGIIVILIGLLLPAMTKARAMSLDVTCKSNMRQIGVMMFTYSASNSGWLPGILANRVADEFPNWKQRLQPSIDQSPRIYECPVDTGIAEAPFQRTPAKTYAMNMYLVRIPGEPYSTGTHHDNYWKNKRLSSVQWSSEAGLVFESRRSEQRASTYAVIPGTFALGRLADLRRHYRKQSNVLMVDGHVQSRTPAEIDLPTTRWLRFWEGRG